MVMACVGHTCAHIPHPLQYSRFISIGTDFLITASGQYSQQIKQDALLRFDGMHLLWSMDGVSVRHSPVFPASPIAGDDSPQR